MAERRCQVQPDVFGVGPAGARTELGLAGEPVVEVVADRLPAGVDVRALLDPVEQDAALRTNLPTVRVALRGRSVSSCRSGQSRKTVSWAMSGGCQRMGVAAIQRSPRCFSWCNGWPRVRHSWRSRADAQVVWSSRGRTRFGAPSVAHLSGTPASSGSCQVRSWQLDRRLSAPPPRASAEARAASPAGPGPSGHWGGRWQVVEGGGRQRPGRRCVQSAHPPG